MTALVKMRGLRKALDGKQVLDGIDLNVMEGESMVVIGMSGAGKSVLVKCLLGLMQPDAGEIIVDGQDWSRMSADDKLLQMRQVGMLFQHSALFDSLPIWQNVAFALLQRGMSKNEARERASEILAMVGLAGTEDKMPSELSGGMVKRAGLARAVCHKPRLLIYDEPITGLDPLMADLITRLMIRFHTELNITSLCIAHSMKLAARFGDRVALLHQGRIARLVEATELEHTTDAMLRQFIDGRADGPIQVQEEIMTGSLTG